MSSSPSRAGDTLVECLVALAVAAAVFVPALGSLRSSGRIRAESSRRLQAAAAALPLARGAATALRLGAEAAPVEVVERPVRAVVRAAPPADGADDATGQREVRVSAEGGAPVRLLSLPPLRSPVF